MTVHSGTFGPVHTGIVSDIKLFGAPHLQRRLEPRSTTSATGPSRCVPPPCGTTAQLCPGLPVPSYVLLAEPCLGSPASNSLWLSLPRVLLLLRFDLKYVFWGGGLGLPRGDIGPLLRLPG